MPPCIGRKGLVTRSSEGEQGAMYGAVEKGSESKQEGRWKPMTRASPEGADPCGC